MYEMLDSCESASYLALVHRAFARLLIGAWAACRQTFAVPARWIHKAPPLAGFFVVETLPRVREQLKHFLQWPIEGR